MTRIRVVWLLILLLAQIVSAAEVKIAESDFRKAWPFSVKEGILRCASQAVTFTANGTTYAVNGTAIGLKRYPDIDKIWLPGEPVWIKDPETGKKVNLGPPKRNIGPVISRGLELCK
jgi:hypothetical protein